jgi:phosphoribosylformylglycinamidine synthase subunit PurS
MKYKAEITIMPLKELLDPQGKAVHHGLENLNLKNIDDVRIGKHIRIQLDASDESQARTEIETACKKLLANPIMEYYEYNLVAAE